VEFRLGIMAMRVSEETEAFRVDLHALGLAPSQEVGEALEQLGRDLGGDGEPLRVEFGEDEGFDGVGLTPMKWIRFVVDGAWHAELHAQPGMRFADADGSPLEIRGLGVSYSESGGRWGATTEVQARFTAEHDMSGVTLELPGRQEVVGPTEWIRLGAP
jgi:catechol 2,3-dioxygenase-like lactoylglutathione lyase family enzyme